MIALVPRTPNSAPVCPACSTFKFGFWPQRAGALESLTSSAVRIVLFEVAFIWRHELAPLLGARMHVTAMMRCALATLCALTGAIRTVSGLQAPPRPKHIRCQRGAASPQENEGDAAPAAAPPPPSSNPFAALKKGFEYAVQTATGNAEYQFGDATKWVGGKAAGAINEVTGKDTCAPASFNHTTWSRGRWRTQVRVRRPEPLARPLGQGES